MEPLKTIFKLICLVCLLAVGTACKKSGASPADFELSHEPFAFPAGLPLPVDVNRTSTELGGEAVRFDTSLTPVELAEFYRREINKTGLLEDSSSVVTERALALAFRGWPGKKIFSIKVSKSANHSNVLVRLAEGQSAAAK